MRKKLDRRKKYTRKVLKESLIALLADDKPISAVTVKEICERADINRSTFYMHFSDPYDLLDHIESEIIEDMVAHLSHYRFTIEEESLKMTQKLLEYIAENRFLFQTLLVKNKDPAFEKRLMEVARRFMMSTVYHMNEADSRYLSTFVVSGAIHVIKDWLENDMDLPPEKMAALINRFANHGMSRLY
ncbi:transcriptional regulator, TetR family [Planifilum fulgidum]|jgi:AcrR family transcriptional regulator|uniref:Transcriptional regulator, TetR family n=1 Tax=Planifilum fulgidum TaxID=201973 RepID=A0A1I2L3F9_9BACL|nr:TetR/AcrR family transcriptional regulator [Planifilum fulgidum]MBO2495473.1 TetR/AcrR family transcriptional regulator [Bacillota bacterium]MBO2532401.1 TetR/AcrR family transcriptional regulator [Thermoactinomycetaceae bacterium]SFF71977.1 transcriptional regulator, TetR family [Planifilum fulgidum]